MYKHHKTQYLEEYLTLTIEHLKERWFDKDVGIVACSIIDVKNRVVFATSTKHPKQKNNWIHAERNAVILFKETYKENPSMNAAFVITLSPCIIDMKHRIKESCSKLLSGLKIKRIHFGYLDEMHVASINNYAAMGFEATVTKTPNSIKICDKLVNLFSQYDNLINTKLNVIKQKLGLTFFKI